jgi:tetratricopeptide (TPR) repeat protein
MTVGKEVRSNIAALMLGLAVVNPCVSQDSWKNTEDSAATASRSAKYADAEKLLLSNLNIAHKLGTNDPRLPRTMLDLAEVYRAEGKYSDALANYEQALQTYTKLYGGEATEISDTLNGEAELFKSLNDYAHAEPLLLRALAIRQKHLPPGNRDIAQSQNDLGELYTATNAFDKAGPLLKDALASRQKDPGPESTDFAHSLQALGTFYKQNREQQRRGRFVPQGSQFIWQDSRR